MSPKRTKKEGEGPFPKSKGSAKTNQRIQRCSPAIETRPRTVNPTSLSPQIRPGKPLLCSTPPFSHHKHPPESSSSSITTPQESLPQAHRIPNQTRDTRFLSHRVPILLAHLESSTRRPFDFSATPVYKYPPFPLSPTHTNPARTELQIIYPPPQNHPTPAQSWVPNSPKSWARSSDQRRCVS